MNCPHCGEPPSWRRAVRHVSYGYLVGIGCTFAPLGWELRTFLVVWPLLIVLLEFEVLRKGDGS